MAIIETTTVAAYTLKGVAIGARHLGMNLVQGYERFGTLPWEKFDEVQSAVGSRLVRFPGGAEAETLFDYSNPQATTAVGPGGKIMQLISPDAFLSYAAANGTQATIVLPMRQLLTNAAFGSRDFDWAQAGELRAYVAWALAKAGPQGIATFELGNEYESYMSSAEYGRVASAAALIVQQEINAYYNAHPGHNGSRPDIAVEVWTLSTGGSQSIQDLQGRNWNVIAEFSQAELAAVTAVNTHYYYTEGKFLGLPNVHSYDNIATTLSYSLSMMQTWSQVAGRQMDHMFSEWNVQLSDARSYGVQQIPILLEMFSTFVKAGVDELDFWSTMYNGTSLASYKGDLQAAGVLMGIMSRELVGMTAADVPVNASTYDIHVFSNGSKTYLYVSSLTDAEIDLNLNLLNYVNRFNLTSMRLIEPDASRSDGVYKTLTGLAPWEDPDTPVLTRWLGLEGFRGGVLSTELGAHETLILELDRAPMRFGSMAADQMMGRTGADRIDGMASNDVIDGREGNDTILGGDGQDVLFGATGSDRLWGGPGYDLLRGGDGDDQLEGRLHTDTLIGGAGNDLLAGGDMLDELWGGLGSDAFIFRTGDKSHDTLRDYSPDQGDYLVYEGNRSAHASQFWLDRWVVEGLGTDTAELILYQRDVGILAVLQDDAPLASVLMQDAFSGAMMTIY